MIIRDMKVLSAGSHFSLRFGDCFLRLRPKSRTINIIPDIQVQQTLEHFLAFRPQNGICLRRITHADIKEPDVFHHKRLIAKINRIPGMQLIGEDRQIRLPGSQINHDFTHGRNPVMLGNSSLSWTERRNDLFFCLLLGRFSVRFGLLDDFTVFQCFRINDFTVNNTVFSKLFPDRNWINIVQPINFRFRIELVIPDQTVQGIGGIRPRDIMPDIIHCDRKRRQFITILGLQAFRDFLCGMAFLYEANHGMLAFNMPVPFPESALNIHLGYNPVGRAVSLG